MDKPKNLTYDVPLSAITRWQPAIKSAVQDGSYIEILDIIGEDWSGNGITAKRVSDQLRQIGNSDVTVYINSPGGDMFEGLAIYNLLKQHQGQVTVRILGLAASAASLIAMAGDEIQIAKAGFLMIHNAWTVAAGNRNDFLDLAAYLEPFDKTMSELYADKTGIESSKLADMMDAETWITGSDAIDMNFADMLLNSDVIEDKSNQNAAAKIDIALAKAGVTRSERRKLLKDYKEGTQNAAEVTHDADISLGEFKSLSISTQEALQFKGEKK